MWRDAEDGGEAVSEAKPTKQSAAELAAEIFALRARIRELEDGLRETLEYITCAIPTKCDLQFAKDIADRLLRGEVKP